MIKPFLALTLLFAAPALAAAPDWTTRVTMSPIGGHVLGNPLAPTRLVEYVSYTCNHCAHFVAEATGPLKAGYVRGGKVSVEVRNAIRDKYDLTAALLARCGGKARFIGNHEAMFANQDAWMPQLAAYDSAGDKPTEEKAALRDIGRKTGLYTLMGTRGFSSRQLDACVNDPAAMKQILAMTKDAWQTLKIHGTPAFTINGALIEGANWSALRSALPTPVN
ncbi:thioredoxin domain-containing protein [Sphingobium sp. AN641]|uniref:DsbA family protein n=1 Tax=Sphingobium sp. AN641 TaxID=3133443 RepID=UPI0030C51221